MSILLTGGAGFTGSHTAVSLLNAGQDIVIVDNLYNSSPKVIDRIEKITGKRPPFVEADCCDQAAMDKLFTDYDITGVIHFAGLKAVGESVEKPLLYYRNNLDSTLTVLEVMRELPSIRLLVLCHGLRRPARAAVRDSADRRLLQSLWLDKVYD